MGPPSTPQQSEGLRCSGASEGLGAGAIGTMPEHLWLERDKLCSCPLSTVHKRFKKLASQRTHSLKTSRKPPRSYWFGCLNTHLLLRRYFRSPGAHRRHPQTQPLAPAAPGALQEAPSPALGSCRNQTLFQAPKSFKSRDICILSMCERRGVGTGSWREKSLNSREKAWIEIQLFQLLLFCPQPSLLRGMKW